VLRVSFVEGGSDENDTFFGHFLINFLERFFVRTPFPSPPPEGKGVTGHSSSTELFPRGHPLPPRVPLRRASPTATPTGSLPPPVKPPLFSPPTKPTARLFSTCGAAFLFPTMLPSPFLLKNFVGYRRLKCSLSYSLVRTRSLSAQFFSKLPASFLAKTDQYGQNSFFPQPFHPPDGTSAPRPSRPAE